MSYASLGWVAKTYICYYTSTRCGSLLCVIREMCVEKNKAGTIKRLIVVRHRDLKYKFLLIDGYSGDLRPITSQCT